MGLLREIAARRIAVQILANLKPDLWKHYSEDLREEHIKELARLIYEEIG